MRRVLGRLPSPALVVAFVALAVALGGGAYAAVNSGSGAVHTCYLKQGGDLRIVSAKAKCAKDEKALTLSRQAARAPVGVPGPSGPPGSNGAPGATGPRGPSAAFTTRVPSFPLIAAVPQKIAELELPAGNYVISSTLWFEGSSSAAEAVSGLKCSLTAGSDEDDAAVQVQMSKTLNAHIPVGLSVAHTAAAPFGAPLICSGVGNAMTLTAHDVELTAIEVGSLTVQP